MPALELDLDLGERLVDPQALLDKAVVDPDHEHDQDHDDGENDDQREVHTPPPVTGAGATPRAP